MEAVIAFFSLSAALLISGSMVTEEKISLGIGAVGITKASSAFSSATTAISLPPLSFFASLATELDSASVASSVTGSALSSAGTTLLTTGFITTAATSSITAPVLFSATASLSAGLTSASPASLATGSDLFSAGTVIVSV